jgi:tight adherence protein B
MRGRATAAAAAGLLAGLLALAATGPAAADGGLRVVNTAGHFPERAYVVALPTRVHLDESRVHVTESGNKVSDLTVVPAAAAGSGDFGVVLLLDASRSMHGAAIRNAVAAARAFAGHRTESQQIAVIAFNRSARVLLPFTTDQRRIDAALAATPQLAEGTRIYDAVDKAVVLLRDAQIVSGTIVVVSDGADTGSRRTLEQITRRARNSHIRIFSVGIRSRTYKPAPLRQLAGSAGGSYSEAASSAQLAAIYDRLGTQLANEYLIRYRSLAGPNEPVRVKITIDGIGGATAFRYRTPALAINAEAPYHRPLSERFWKSTVVMILVTELAALLIALALIALLRPRPHTLRRRMANFVSLASPEEEEEERPASRRLLASAERSLEATRWWTRFQEKLELAEIHIPPIRIAFGTIVATIVVMWLITAVAGSLLFGLFALGIPAVVNAVVNRKVNRRRGLFAEQLPDNLQVLASALRAGHSFIGALSVVASEAQEPSRSEFQRVIGDEQLGVPLEDALRVVVHRMDNRDVEQVSLVAALQRQRGANAAEVLERVTETVRARFELRRMVQTLTAQGRMARWIVSLLPVALLLVISAINPTYLSPLFNTTSGHVLLAAAGVMLVAGSLVIKRIVNIKV